MDFNLALPVSIILGLLSFGLMAKWYLMPILDRRTLEEALTPILFFHSFRYIGLAFLIPGVTHTSLDPRFAVPAAYGDLLAALLAILTIVALRRQWSFALPLTWFFNGVGLIDLLNAVFQGLRFTPDGDLGATYFIPALLVPALLVTHIMIFALLRTKEASKEKKSLGDMLL